MIKVEKTAILELIKTELTLIILGTPKYWYDSGYRHYAYISASQLERSYYWDVR